MKLRIAPRCSKGLIADSTIPPSVGPSTALEIYGGGGAAVLVGPVLLSDPGCARCIRDPVGRKRRTLPAPITAWDSISKPYR